MLMLKRIGAAVGAALLAIGILVLGVASPALANNCWIDPMTGKTVCDVVVTNPGDPGTSNPGGQVRGACGLHARTDEMCRQLREARSN